MEPRKMLCVILFTSFSETWRLYVWLELNLSGIMSLSGCRQLQHDIYIDVLRWIRHATSTDVYLG